MGCLLWHKWNGCMCRKCGEKRNEGHVYQPVEGRCESRCVICGNSQPMEHTWDGCKCTRCGSIRDWQHKFIPVAGRCVKVCSDCGKEDDIRNAQHNFQPVPGKCVKVCPVCGKEDAGYTAQHDYRPVPGKCLKVCSVCGQEDVSRNAQHTYQAVSNKCVEKCAVCGDVRKTKHQYENGNCTVCGADINARGENGIPPLIDAAYDGNVERVKVLLSGGANVNICTDETPLMAAAKKGYDAEHMEIVKLLLAAGANVNATDPQGSSALRLAKRKGLTAMVDLLAAHGGKYLGA